MKTIESFINASFNEKCDFIVTDKGCEFLMARNVAEANYTIFLYHAYGYFIEVHYNNQHGRLMMIGASKSSKILDPYLTKISINSVFA